MAQHYDSSHSSVIQLRKTRGRPSAPKRYKDLGTKELQEKRAQQSTADPIDILLEKSLITESQHQLARRFLWLHRIIYGCPWVKAYDHSQPQGRPLIEEDEAWLARRQQQYHAAMAELSRHGALEVMRDCCLYQRRPLCLRGGYQQHYLASQELSILRDGLDILASLWEKATPRN